MHAVGVPNDGSAPAIGTLPGSAGPEGKHSLAGDMTLDWLEKDVRDFRILEKAPRPMCTSVIHVLADLFPPPTDLTSHPFIHQTLGLCLAILATTVELSQPEKIAAWGKKVLTEPFLNVWVFTNKQITKPVAFLRF